MAGGGLDAEDFFPNAGTFEWGKKVSIWVKMGGKEKRTIKTPGIPKIVPIRLVQSGRKKKGRKSNRIGWSPFVRGK